MVINVYLQELQNKTISDENLKNLFYSNFKFYDNIFNHINNSKVYEEKLYIKRVTKTIKGGKMRRVYCLFILGDKKNFLGIGAGKGLTFHQALNQAKKKALNNIIYIQKGCGHVFCECSNNHSLLFATQGHCSSLKINLNPAPKNKGLICSKIGKTILSYAGIKDCYSTVLKGNYSNPITYIKAIQDALLNYNKNLLEYNLVDLNLLKKAIYEANN